jgi:lipopolysaccharide export system protein LptA
MTRTSFAFAVALTLTVVLAGWVQAASTLQPPASKQVPSVQSAPVSGTFGVWTVHMTEVDYNNTTGNFNTPNHVTMTRNGGDINADRADGNAQRQIATLYGNVVVHDVQGAFHSGGPVTASGNSATASRGPATLTADRLQIDGAAKVYVALGNVHYTQADTNVTADKGTLDDAAHVLVLEGNVHVTQGSRSLAADRMRYDTVTGDAHAEGKNVILQFPSGPVPSIATPRPITIKNPLSKRTPHPTPS